ncbi:hypothetical protein EDD90_3328 [Streptomyces sp. Ag109_O5-1]|uniref:hypothetical protein n=1 Tax=Streptomyces sp. Ag109_O5-1 TaxID=1938851 RepID=UPI000F99802C|nr:hypothetical protein [Streptomyces sp. Ag109_O5-1]RPE40292.1 hypothetical protein EDD90_3328 [Streptomyces sp. Ag109_O5-1]
MTDEQPHPPAGPLTDLQCARVERVRRDLERTRADDLTQLDADGLILLVERLRGCLVDVLEVVDEVLEESDELTEP